MARSYVLLSVQSLDTLEMADLLRARALALMAIAEAEGSAPEPRDEALLAGALGYAGAAKRRGENLPIDDPIRLYVTDQTAALRAAAEKPEASPLARYLALLSTAARGDAPGWNSLAKRILGGQSFSLPVLGAAIRLHSFEMNASLGTAVLYASLASVRGVQTRNERDEASPDATSDLTETIIRAFIEHVRQQLHMDQAAVVRDFETALQTRCAAAPESAPWDSETCRAWHRGFFYAGLYALGHRYLDELGTVDATKDFAAYLQGSPEGPGVQFARWYADMSSVLSGEPVGARQFEDLSKLTWFGRPVIERTARVLIDRYQPGRDASADIGAAIAQRLDGRPEHVDAMIRVSSDPLLDFPRVERLCRAWLALGGRPGEGWALRCRGFLADERGLVALTAQRDLDVAARADALALYCNLPTAPPKLCRTRFRALAEESGYERSVTRPWVEYADKRRDFAESQRAVEGWLAHHDASAGLIWYVYRGRLAYCLSMQGRNQEAWKVIERALGSGQGAVMLWATDILARLGRSDEALKLAQQAIERYPDGGAQRAVLAEIFWRVKRDSDAALVLEPSEPAYRVDEAIYRDDVADRFGRAFRDQPDTRVESAMTFLKSQGIYDRKLSYLIAPIAASGRNELAFRMASSLTHLHRHWWDIAGFNAQAFGYLEGSQGRAAASHWIQGVIPAVQREAMLEAFFDRKDYALLWDAVPPAAESKLSDWACLLRAGASVADPAIARERRDGLLERVRDGNPPKPPRVLARHLLGLDGREAVLASLHTPMDRCTAEYFFGLQQIAASHYDEASEWLQVVFDGCTRAPSWRLGSFARSTLTRWYTTGQNLREAERRKIF